MSRGYRPQAPRPPRQVRERSRDTDWWAAREWANTVQCPPWPRGCAAPIGSTCVNRYGDELINQPAHDAREKRAAAAEPHPDELEETP